MTTHVLLSLALSLLIAAQQPNVPEELRIQAIGVANTAITAAMKENQMAPELTVSSAKSAVSAPSAPEPTTPECTIWIPKPVSNVPACADTSSPDYGKIKPD